MYNNNYYPYSNYNSYKPSLLNRVSNIAGKTKVNWSNILNATQRTLNIINQAIPVIYQMKPIYNNAKTIFKVIGAVKEPKHTIINRSNSSKKNISTSDEETNFSTKKSNDSKATNINSQPTFFL